uniref:Uncharacterized protein n=1 Tax=Zosterops lateralis melanops TaxID=1220523 RepID=A0A8D2PKD6_ZOSLA
MKAVGSTTEPHSQRGPPLFSYLCLPKAALGENNLVRVDLHKNIPQPGDGGAASVLILGLHVEVGQLGAWPALPGEEVGAGTLEVKEEAVEGVVMWISEHHAVQPRGALLVLGPAAGLLSCFLCANSQKELFSKSQALFLTFGVSSSSPTSTLSAWNAAGAVTNPRSVV